MPQAVDLGVIKQRQCVELDLAFAWLALLRHETPSDPGGAGLARQMQFDAQAFGRQARRQNRLGEARPALPPLPSQRRGNVLVAAGRHAHLAEQRPQAIVADPVPLSPDLVIAGLDAVLLRQRLERLPPGARTRRLRPPGRKLPGRRLTHAG
ncbi:MAG TPA: hypothetical protein PK177_14750, partial [Burkholderiaceae bacterium]|nr:hypothetical protein [Burkholderiaceae bacterium]